MSSAIACDIFYYTFEGEIAIDYSGGNIHTFASSDIRGYIEYCYEHDEPDSRNINLRKFWIEVGNERIGLEYFTYIDTDFYQSHGVWRLRAQANGEGMFGSYTLTHMGFDYDLQQVSGAGDTVKTG